MITVNSAPISGRILLDANNTLISVTSSNGEGYYFRVLLYVDDVLHDTQGWSRKDEFTAEKDLKKFYNAYYETVFNETFSNGLTEQTHLKKKITVTIQEKLLSDDSLAQEITLPEFYFMFNIVPVQFTDQSKVQVLGIEPSILLIPSSGKLAVPFMVNATAENIVVTVKDNFGNTLNTQSLSSVTGKKIYLYHFDFSTVSLVSNVIYFTLKIAVGVHFLEKNIRLLSLPDYPVKEIAFQNNFGFWIYAYLDGQLSIDNSLEIQSYEQADNTDVIYEINETKSYSLNTGSLLISEKDIINQIATALKSKIYLNSGWISMNTTTKKVGHYKDRNNNYSESLTFTVKKNYSVENAGIEEVDYSGYIVLESVTPGEENISLAFSFADGYLPEALKVFCEKLVDGDIEAIVLAEVSNISPQLIDLLDSGTWRIYLQSTSETYIYSNPITVVIP